MSNNPFYPTSPSKVQIDSPPGIVPARVMDVILDERHPSFTGYSDIGAIRYRILGDSGLQNRVDKLGKAYPKSRNFITFPLLEEIVYICIGPISQEQVDSSDTSKTYYETPLSVWNHPHWNPHPDSNVSEYPKAEENNNFIDSAVLAPLLPFPGDTLIESRFGSSIRFTGAKSPNNPYIIERTSGEDIEESNNMKALTIIRNGQKETGDGYTPILEDINEDATSIYLTEAHALPISASSEDNLSFIGASFINSDQEDPENRLVVPPAELNIYSGSQAVINSDRIVLNSKEDSVLISGNEAVGISGNSVNIDGRGENNKVVISAQKIYIGINALRLRNATKGSSQAKIAEPAILGRTMVTLQKDLIAAMYKLVDSMAQPHLPSSWIPKQISAANTIKAELERLENDQETALSENIFLEPNLRNRRV